MNQVSVVISAFILDMILGDPYNWPHPVKVIGRSIGLIDYWLQSKEMSNRKKQLGGLFLWVIIVGGTGVVTWLILALSYRLNYVLGTLVAVYLSYTTLAIKSLGVEGRKIRDVLKSGSLEDARQQVGMIVGRDTSELSADEIGKATIETVAENTNDGVIAPLFYLVIGGPVLAMMYKAVNTLDSMVGYQNEKHQDIGRVSAILDDVFSYLPARITWVLMIIASFLLKLDGQSAVRIGIRDRRKHKSPNSAFSEAVVAGALGIQLGGTHQYGGLEIYKPTIGDNLRQVIGDDISKTIQILYVTSGLGVCLFLVIKIIVFKLI